ncbi:retinol dehydrogenase 14 [Penicillium malachiteum]|uniref:Retinol dehydrogenase 14 n=1 Tax=Penicillium malachiteum TaxID=1324776 RepID=A0AAD6MSB3_9EURO|nr:retinol dehydrogenase 14 [Penicillium malachiteum]
MAGLHGLLFTKLTLPPVSAIEKKTILITGANTGLGREAARHALSLGAGTIIMGVRTLSKGEEAKANIEATTGCADKSKVLVWLIDLESFNSVQEFAARAQKYVSDGGRLDMAIMNAGIASLQYATTSNGWERGIQVNVLSTTLLSLSLLPLLLHTRDQDPSARPHLALLTSDIHKSIKFPERSSSDSILSLLNGQEQWKKSQDIGGATERYGVTKLMDLFVTMQIAELVPHDSFGEPLVIVNAVAPGFCKSDLLTRENAPWILKLVQALFARTVENGSKTLLHAVTQGAESHGKWLENQAITDPGTIVTSDEAAAVRNKLWVEITSVLRDIDPKLQTQF